MSSPAVCQSCGTEKRAPLIPCKSCEFVPTGDERATAWLFSREYLSEEEMAEAARRIVEEGQRPDPSRALKQRAKEAMGALPFEHSSDLPLSRAEMWGLGTANLLLTPLTGLAIWHGLRPDRPRAATQALRLTLPMAVVLALVWISIIGSQISKNG